MSLYAFYAYPQSSPMIGETIKEAVELAAEADLKIQPWENMGVIGFKIDSLIRDRIDEASILIADITYPNPNVLYEIGFAIAKQKPVLPTVNAAVEGAEKRAQKTGLFDTIGYATYGNSDELFRSIVDFNATDLATNYIKAKNHAQPLFILDLLAKINFRNHIIQSVKNANLNYRSYDPSEVPRVTATQLLSEVSSSSGVIVPIISEDIVDSLYHNLRAAFIIGLCHGLAVECLAIQYGNSPIALDYRDFVTNSTFRRETEEKVHTFSEKVLIWNQSFSESKRAPKGILSEIDFGSPTAENEIQKLGGYFVRTAEFSRAIRAEGAVVIGRKGAGKSAVYIQASSHFAKNRYSCIVDLRPASHNLSEMREAILSVVSAGVFDHTIAAFWQYIVYTEVLLKVRELSLPFARNDFKLQERVREIEERFDLNEAIVSGDFTSRLKDAIDNVIEVISGLDSPSDLRSKLTNIMFEKPIPQLRESIISFSDMFDDIVVLIDDLDKGWPPRQVEDQDVSTIKHLIEVLNKIQRDMRRHDVSFRHLLFLRSDIYEKLVENTSDRGKYNVIKLDWSDPQQLRHLIKQRALHRIDKDRHDVAWSSFNTTLEGGVDAIDILIKNSLRRPRFLIDLSERTLSVAINRGNSVVDKDDVEEGLRQMALYLVSDFGYEMRDVAGTPEDVFYLFIGVGELLTEPELFEILESADMGVDSNVVVDLLLWYGFLGIVGGSGEYIFIYDREYDFRRLEAERRSVKADLLYCVNGAFLRGLAN